MRQQRADWFRHRLPAIAALPDRVVFLDETAVKTNLMRLRGRAPRGERLRTVPNSRCFVTAKRSTPAGSAPIRFATPDQASDGVAFARLTLGQIAAGLGVPQHLLDGDLSSANYSSLRAGLLPFRQRIEQFQYHQIVPQVLTPLWRRVVTRLYLVGEIEDLASALKVEWLPPRPMQVDPEKDTRALVAQIEAGLTSRRQAVASLGWNVAELDAEIAADRERAAALGLTFGASTNAD